MSSPSDTRSTVGITAGQSRPVWCQTPLRRRAVPDGRTGLSLFPIPRPKEA